MVCGVQKNRSRYQQKKYCCASGPTLSTASRGVIFTHLFYMTVLDVIFCDSTLPEPGQRLGISFVKAQQEEIEIVVKEKVLVLAQSSMGLTAISSCVWDCGLALVDYLQSQSQGIEQLGRTMNMMTGHTCLDIGCGTGVVGIAALALGAEFVCFTDTSSAEGGLTTNLKLLEAQLFPSLSLNKAAAFIEFDWVTGSLPDFQSRCNQFVGEDRCWDTLLLSDVLYEQASHAALMRLLRSLSFRQAYLAYKRRHDDPESRFLRELEEWCELSIVPFSEFTLVNVTRAQMTSGLYIIVFRKRCPLL